MGRVAVKVSQHLPSVPCTTMCRMAGSVFKSFKLNCEVDSKDALKDFVTFKKTQHC